MKVFRDYALGWVLLGLFLLFWIGQTVVGWQEFLAEQSEHGQVAHVFGDGGYVWNWARTTLENWQSEMLQLFAMVVLTSFLIFKGSPESKDGDDEMKQTLARWSDGSRSWPPSWSRRWGHRANAAHLVDDRARHGRLARTPHDDCYTRRRSARSFSSHTRTKSRRSHTCRRLNRRSGFAMRFPRVWTLIRHG